MWISNKDKMPIFDGELDELQVRDVFFAVHQQFAVNPVESKAKRCSKAACLYTSHSLGYALTMLGFAYDNELLPDAFFECAFLWQPSFSVVVSTPRLVKHRDMRALTLAALPNAGLTSRASH